MSEIRLGDIIDDHCTRCRLLTNHSVVSIVNGGVSKVRCRTCHHEHGTTGMGKAARKGRSCRPTSRCWLLSPASGRALSLPRPSPSAPARAAQTGRLPSTVTG